MIGFALFGAGRIGAVHAANIAASARARLVSVHDVNDAAARHKWTAVVARWKDDRVL